MGKERVTASEVVYDLTVEKHHCYFANGFLVSNSDSFGLMCVAYEEPQQTRKLKYPKLGTV